MLKVQSLLQLYPQYNYYKELQLKYSSQFTLTVVGPNNSWGDLDNNGSINVADIVLLVDWILNGNNNLDGDLDQNGNVNVADIVLLISYILN